MEKSYFCSEQVGQMQATYDAVVMLKMIHDADCDIVNDPISFYCHEFGDQYPIFIECLKRVFGDFTRTFEGQNEHWQEVNTYRLPFPELSLFFAIVGNQECGRYAAKFNEMMKMPCDFFEFEMEGFVARNCLQITLTGSYGILSPFLKVLLEIRQEVLEIIRDHKSRIAVGTRNIVLLRMVYDRLGTVPQVSVGERTAYVFSRIIDHLQGDLGGVDAESLTFDEMRTMLADVLDRATINRKDEAA
jgi:hypothetical protein